MKNFFRPFFEAINFLTIVHVPIKDDGDQSGGLAHLIPWFPAVGLLLGLLVYLLFRLTQNFLAVPICAVLVLMAWEIITGGLHLDGLADTVDGVAAGGGKEGILRAMRDERLGVFAVAAIVLVLLAKWSAISSLSTESLILAPILGRWAMMVLARISSPAREEGIGMSFVPFRNDKGLAISTAGVLAVAVFLEGFSALIAVGAVFLLTLGISRFFQSRTGGITGDVFGFTCEVSEVLALILVF
jgi:adenosylcobinamide-GDP ribazoletransferase